MKTRILIIFGMVMLIFGLGNLFSYFLISFPVLNTPFPFEHVELRLEDGGKTLEIGYLPINEAIFDPYWLFWSLVLYAGIAVTSYAVWKNRK